MVHKDHLDYEDHQEQQVNKDHLDYEDHQEQQVNKDHQEQQDTGPPGLAGPAGPPGLAGAAAPTMNLTVRNVPGQIVALSEVTQSIATCNSDELVIGGGFSIANGPGMVLSSVPIDNSWVVFAANPFAIGNSSLQAFAECARSN